MSTVTLAEVAARFAAAVADANTAKGLADAAVQGQRLQTQGIREDTEEVSDAAIAIAVDVAKLEQAYALDEDDDALFKQMAVNETMLDRMRDEDLPAALRDIYSRASGIGTTILEDYGVTAQRLTEFLTAIGSYEAAIPKVRDAVNERAGYGTELARQIKELRKAFARMDRLVRMFAQTAPGFVEQYRRARIVIDLRGPGSDGGGTNQ